MFSFAAGCLLIKIDQSADTKESQQINGAVKKKSLKLSDLKEMSRSFLLFVFASACAVASIHPFYSNMGKFFLRSFGFDNKLTGHIISLPYFCASLTTPLFGSIISKIGKHSHFMVIATSGITACHIFYALMPDCDQCLYPIIAVVVFGMSHSLYVIAQWPLLSMLVESRLGPTAFSISRVAENLGVTFVPLVVGYLRDHTVWRDGYFWVSVLLGCFASTSSLISSNLTKSRAKPDAHKADKIIRDDEDPDLKPLTTEEIELKTLSKRE